jgi:site-specific DNA recombinase
LQSKPPAPKAVALPPTIVKRYEEQLVRLEEALANGVSAGDGEAAEAIRDLVDTVTVFRDPARPGGVAVEIAGRLNVLLGEEAYPNRRANSVRNSPLSAGGLLDRWVIARRHAHIP